MGLSQAPVAGSAEAAGANVLGEGGLDSGPDRVAVLPLPGPLVEAVGLLDLVQFTGGQQGKRARTDFGVGALGPVRAGPAGGLPEADLDVVVAGDPQWLPGPAGLPAGADDPTW